MDLFDKTIYEKMILEILEAQVRIEDNSNGPCESQCPFCGDYSTYKGNQKAPQMEDLDHDYECLWTLARKAEHPQMFL